MPISRDVVEHVSRLAHVGLRQDEVQEMTEQLSSVLEHIAVLQQVNTDGVAPTAHSVAIHDVMRDDEVRPSWPPADVLANAPRRSDNLFQVQAILD